MSKFSAAAAPLLSLVLSVFVLTDDPGLPLGGYDLSVPTTRIGAMVAPDGRQYPTLNPVAGGWYGYYAAVPQQSYTPSTFNMSREHPDNGTATRMNLARSHAFSQNLYRRQYDNTPSSVTLRVY